MITGLYVNIFVGKYSAKLRFFCLPAAARVPWLLRNERLGIKASE